MKKTVNRKLLLLLAPALLLGCSEDEFDPTAADATLTACTVVEKIFAPKCNDCHKPGGDYPDLSYDGLAALINVESEGYPGQVQVVPGDAEASFLYRKIAGNLTADEGDPMPEKKALPDATIAFIAQWIQEGASMDCTPDPTNTSTEAYHPAGYAEATVHGYEMELGLETDCRQCHGDNLQGADDAPDCDSCHQEGWREDCTYCHGGAVSDSGAPPRDLAGLMDLTMLSFKAHGQHEAGDAHPAYECEQCHDKPTDVMTPGHIFDDETAGVAEVVFSAGLSAQGTYNGNGSCSNLYCHGNGRNNAGTADHDDGQLDCNACHAGPTATTAWRTMSGEHSKHMRERLACTDCHNSTVNSAGAIAQAALHVNGQVDLDFGTNNMTRTNNRCTGTCHNERHTNETW
ncbi:MAG: CxxxxCH/CxxCH domain-containing protein [Alphaproteobacteria bacterium]|nr:CxxxxCH/CxxCH domain-containing protein [Alphaproteobacteria bacterium]